MTVNTENMYGLRIISALQSGWEAIRANHPDLPDAVIVTGSGYDGRTPKNGHFAPERWGLNSTETHTEHHPEVERVEGGVLPAVDVTKTVDVRKPLPEIFMAGERIAEGGILVMQTLIHEASHAVAHARGVPDTSGGGRYHNRKFATTAEELGLKRPENVDKSIGFSQCTITEETQERYAGWIEGFNDLPNLKGSLLSHLLIGGTATVVGRGRAGRRSSVECECFPPRKISVTPRQLEQGGIICGVCEARFTEVGA